ncbi:Hydroquinone glucosyltransferase [Morella rubra]|uniref:Hydroquinone glucosyltransferase n=1 Tax=Morella rubra TaxID=262757 RepID=A0A6A1UGT8_9ROSI|nr:Hydroquinone glucosyltransferase [Morella rubra]
MTTVLEALPISIDRVFLPPVSLEDLHTVHTEIQICRAITLSLPSLRDVFKCLVTTTWFAAFVGDVYHVFGCEAFEVAKEFKVMPYVFVSISATVLSLGLHMPKLDETVQGEFRELPEPLKLPRWSIPIQGTDLLDALLDRQTKWYKLFLSHVKRLRLAERINQRESAPSGSFLFVSFGSGGTLSFDHLTELALGLELSGQRFVWVVRSPNNGPADAAYVANRSHEDPLAFLPNVFGERIEGQGLVVPCWAPQTRILRHGSIGGFLTHCGWNSTLEGIASGIPLIAWLLFAEQRMNAVVLTEDLKVALRQKANEEGLIEREEIARVIKDLMASEEGKRVQNRMKDLKIAAEKALTGDGSSKRALSEWASKMASN